MVIKQLSSKEKEVKKKPSKTLVVSQKKFVDTISLKVHRKDSPPMVLKSCGHLYRMSNPFGSMVSSPMTRKEINEMLTSNLDPKSLPSPQAELVRLPSKALRPPLDFCKLWGQQLLDYDTEALCVYGVNRKDPEDWLGVVPEQEVTSASVDVDDFSTAVAVLSSKGYKVVGTLHTHPGGMTSCSSTDTGELWNEFAGIHLIITHTGILSYYFSTRGYTWDLKGYEGFQHVDLWSKNKIPTALRINNKLLGEDGTLKYRDFILEKTWGTGKAAGFGFGYDEYDDWYKTPTKKKSNLTYSSTAKVYYGTWNQTTRTTQFVVQKRHIKVSVSYCDALGGYYDSVTGGYYAGEKPKVGHFSNKRYRTIPKKKVTQTPFQIVNKKRAKEIEKGARKKKAKEIITSDSLDLIVDSLEEGSVGPAKEFAVRLDLALEDVNIALLAIEDLVTEALSETVNHSATMRATIIRLLLILPLFEKLVWGKKAREDNHYAGIIPDSWKGRK